MDCGCVGGTLLLSYTGREFEIQWSAFDFWPLPFTAGEDNDLKPEKTISWQPFAQMNSQYPLSSDNRIQRLKIHRFVDFCAKVRLKTFPQKSQWINIELYCMLACSSVETENWWSWQEDGRWLRLNTEHSPESSKVMLLRTSVLLLSWYTRSPALARSILSFFQDTASCTLVSATTWHKYFYIKFNYFYWSLNNSSWGLNIFM